MFKLPLFLASCGVLLNLVALSQVKNDCPELPTCFCRKVKHRAKCWNIMEIPPVPPEIQILELSDNAIIEIKRSDFKHNALTDLFLGNNKIRAIERDAFRDLSELTQLNLSNNQLRVLDTKIFRNNKKLKHLHLNNNPDLEFSLTDLPATVEQLNMVDTNIMITYNTIRNLSNLHSYSGNFCIKSNCSESTELNVKFTRDDDSSNLTTDTQNVTEEIAPIYEKSIIGKEINSESDTPTTEGLYIPEEEIHVKEKINSKTDTRPTTERSLPIPKKADITEEINSATGCSNTNTYVLSGIALVQTLLLLICFTVIICPKQKKKILEMFQEVTPDQEPLTSQSQPIK